MTKAIAVTVPRVKVAAKSKKSMYGEAKMNDFLSVFGLASMALIGLTLAYGRRLYECTKESLRRQSQKT